MARKISGGKYKKFRKKKIREVPGKERKVILSETKRKKIRTRGGSIKSVLLATNQANVLNPKTKKIKTSKIIAVTKIPSNRFLKNVLVKGAIIQTDLGEARITNRPSQEGMVNAVLISA